MISVSAFNTLRVKYPGARGFLIGRERGGTREALSKERDACSCLRDRTGRSYIIRQENLWDQGTCQTSLDPDSQALFD
jgi:hypothetical protein